MCGRGARACQRKTGDPPQGSGFCRGGMPVARTASNPRDEANMSFIISTAGRAGRGLGLLLILGLLTAASSACASKSIRPATDDSSLTTRVRAALLNDPQVAATGINVAASGGVV